MIRHLQIELMKVLSYRAFWFMISIYLLLLAFMIFGIPGLIDYIAEKSGEPTKFRIFKAIVFNFPDIWQNIAFVSGMRYFIKIILGIIIIILVTTEYHFLTIRAHIINGYSKKDFLTGKVELVLFLSLISTVVLFFSGLYLGFIHSSSKSASDVFGKMIFLPAYFIEVSTYLVFCLFLGILLKKTGITFIAHFVYLIAEPILDFKLPEALTPYLPLNAMNGIIKTPNTSLIKIKSPGFDYDFQEAIHFTDVGICLGYGLVFIALSYYLLKRRDV